MNRPRGILTKLQYGIFFLFFTIISCSPKEDVIYKTDVLELIKLAEHTYIHKSYLQTDDYGKVSCNGLVYIENNQAVVIDTPANSQASQELIDWLSNDLKCQISAVVPTHFHKDCLAGLNLFHENGVMSYGNSLTIELSIDSDTPFPKIGFDENFELPVDNTKIQFTFPGEGHTLDNIVAYIPNDKVLFGGCLLKAMNADRGFVGDGNTEDWSATVQNIKNKFSEVVHIVPGHGTAGHSELLDYTIELFQ